MIPPVSGGSGTRGSSSCATARSTPAILAELADRLADPEDGAVVGFLGRTRATPGTPAPGQEAEAARHAGRAVESLEYEAHETMALAHAGDHRRRDRGALRGRPAWRSSTGPARCRSARRRSRSSPCRPHRDAAFEAARYAIDETKARAPDLEGRAVRRRPRLDRPPGTDRAPRRGR